MDIIKQFKYIITAYAVTPTHFGIGRAPGVVDLPIARDPLGYPVMPSTGVKGALKNRCAAYYSSNKNPFNDNGRIKCEKVRECCCLFGPEPGESRQGASALSVLDLTLLAIPVPSTTHGWVYVTTPHLLMRLESLMEFVNVEKKNSLAKLINEKDLLENNKVLATEKLISVKNTIGFPGYNYEAEKLNETDLEWVDTILPRNASRGLVRELKNRLVIVGDEDGPRIIEKGILRYWRVRLNYRTKTVSTGGLWSEEYLPIGTVFVGGLIPSGRTNNYCRSSSEHGLKKAVDALRKGSSYLFVGGKESVGKGLIKLITSGGGNDGGSK